MSREDIQKFLKKYSNPKDLTLLEDCISREFGYDKGDVLVGTVVDYSRLRDPDDVLLVSDNGKKESLFKIEPVHRKNLQYKADQSFSILVCTKPEMRRKLYDDVEDVKEYITSSLE